MNDSLDLITVNGNRRPGDRKIYFYFKKINFKYLPFLKELYHWVQIKAKVEDNNYPPPDQGKEWLRKFLNYAIDGKSWEEAKNKFDPNNKMKE